MRVLVIYRDKTCNGVTGYDNPLTPAVLLILENMVCVEKRFEQLLVGVR
jgi:hypothetical protein